MRIIQNFVSLALAAVLVLTFVNFFTRNSPVPRSEITEMVLRAPEMRQQLRFSDSFTYEEVTYEYHPMADYELWGLVTAEENLDNIFSLSRTREAVNFKNVCVVWGDNLKNGAYVSVRYKIGHWVCAVSGRGEGIFDPHMMSYNHLLAADTAVQEKIRRIRVGDQIHLKGYLVNYTNTQADWEKPSSFSLEDEGVHSAEIFLVTEAEIIKRGNVRQHLFYENGLMFFLILLIIKLFLAIINAKMEVKSLEKYEEQNKF